MMSVRLTPVRGAARLLVNPAAANRSGLLNGITGASDWRRRAADRVGLTSERLRPGTSDESPSLPWPDDIDALVEEWCSELPGFELVGVALPRQTDRPRLSALGWHCGAPVVLKAGRRNTGIEREAEVLVALAADPLPGIVTPKVIADNAPIRPERLRHDRRSPGDDTPTWLATTAVHLARQSPTLDARLDSFEHDLTARLSHLPTSDLDHYVTQTGEADTITDRVIVHGDLTPWNLRRTPYSLALFDWEACGWGSAGYDQRCYTAACRDLRRTRWRLGRRESSDQRTGDRPAGGAPTSPLGSGAQR